MRGAGAVSFRLRQLLRSWTLQEPQIERREYQDDPDVHDQPRPEVVPED